ncbi:MAG: copper amine oxidase N-terminal domain-containing protein [Sedimentibacter sp.]|uniref:copper amine oxidase N-terminal domain-containing protein n=1 Tax=Sedimentibacter sp. TaxID=1960295 RepID=UPI003158EC45
MKDVKKVSLILALLLTLVFPTVAFGEDLNGDTQTNEAAADDIQVEAEDSDDIIDEDTAETDGEDTEEGTGKGNVKDRSWKEAKAAVEADKNEIESLKDEVGAKLEEVEAQLEAAEAAGDEAKIAELKLQLQNLKIEQNEYKLQLKSKIAEMQEIVRNKYTAEELEELAQVSESLASLGSIEVIPVENVLFLKGNAKFDTPPVIKEGRTLIPVRAISEAMGADVDYNSEEQTVTITKDGKVIVFSLAEGTVSVNESEAAIDVPAEIMNNRTMVPLRFIAEQLGLTVEWDQELETITIE